MNKPSAAAFLFGNPIVLLALLTGTLWFGWRGLSGAADAFVLAFACLLVGGFSARCANAIMAYQAWKTEWDAMAGPNGGGGGISLRWLRGPLAFAVWAIGLRYSLELSNVAAYQLPIGMFWIATVLIVVLQVRRLFARRSGNSRSFDVAQALRRPASSPSVQQALRLMPEFCRALLQQS